MSAARLGHGGDDGCEAAVVDGPVGAFGVGWTRRGLRRVIVGDLSRDHGALSRRELAAAREAERRSIANELENTGFRLIDAPTDVGAKARDRLLAHLAGDDSDYTGLPLDLEGATRFTHAVFAAARAIPRGQTRTYAELAATIDPMSPAPRAVGSALGRNPLALVIPCHRVVSAVSSAVVGGYPTRGGLSTKAALLVAEGGALGDAGHVVARRHLQRVDAGLGALARKLECTLPVQPRGHLFRTLVRAISGQQLSTKAAATIFSRVEALVVGGAPALDRPATGWTSAAPSALASLSRPALRAAGLSAAKAASVHDLARKVDGGTLDLNAIVRAPEQVVVDKLTEVRGIGRWTVQMLLIFDLGRPDVLPTADLGIRKGFEKIYRLKKTPTIDAMVERAEAWRPFRSIASFYLWRSLDAV